MSRILVPIDFSAQSDAALAYARLFGRSFGASLHLLHVARRRPRQHGAPAVTDVPVPPLQELRDRIPREPWCRDPAVRVVDGADPATEITRYAGDTGIALIVMGTHGRTGVVRLLMGSVAEKVVRTAPCPVVTVHGGGRSSPTPLRRILVATDFSAASDAAIDAARLLAVRFSTTLHLLHVLPETLAEGGGGSDVLVAEAPEVRTLRLTNARERLAHRIPRGLPSSTLTTEVIIGDPAEAIAAYADDNHFDLIVMGTHGRTGIAYLVGSVAGRVVRTAQCPVMTVRTAWSQAESMRRAGGSIGAPA